MCILAAGFFAASLPLGAQEHSGHLPIDLPKDAQINFDVDAPAKELIPFIAQMMSGEGFDPTAGASRTIAIKTGLGTVNVDTKDLAALLSPIRELHAVSYSGDGKDHALEHYQHEFSEHGMTRLASIGGSSSVLIMREDGPSGRYLAVMEQGKRVTVVRTDGMPDLGVLGQLALEKLTEAGQKVKHRLKI